jgi:hypothetical protein
VQSIDKTTFLAKAKAHGIGVNPRYAHNWPRNLSFTGVASTSRYWVPPEEPGELSVFVAAVLDSLGGWGHVVLWPKCVPFDATLRGEDIEELARIADAYPALGSVGGVEVGRSEAADLCMLIEALVQHGWSWPTDVFVIPDSFDAILMVDHHEAIHAEFADAKRCSQFVQSMETSGFPLPDARPDPTFKSKPDGSA